MEVHPKIDGDSSTVRTGMALPQRRGPNVVSDKLKSKIVFAPARRHAPRRTVRPAMPAGIQSCLAHETPSAVTWEFIRAISTVCTGSSTFRMARIYPFRAWRYNPTAVKLDDVVTQPYDKISPAMQQAYYQRSPFNLVRIILGLPELFDAERGESVYTRAARDLRAWQQQGILIQEKSFLRLCLCAALPRTRRVRFR